jgi:hypothetical protein
MILRGFCLSLLCLANLLPAAGQKATLNGLMVDSVTRSLISAASIRNVFSGVTTISNKGGVFFIEAQRGNILAFSAAGYYSDTLSITDSLLALPSLVVILRPLPSTLPEVTVSGTLTRYQLDSMERRKEFVATAGKINIPAVGHTNDMGFGIALNLDRFSKKEKKKHKAYDLFDITEEEAYINYRWTEDFVYKYTKLNGDTLTAFMQTYRPTYDWLRENPAEEDLLYYLNKQLKKYFRGVKD